MDYNSLTKQIQDYSNRTDDFFLDQIPDFINQGISRIYSEARSIGFQKFANNSIFVNNPIIDKPNDWKETISLSITDADTLIQTFLLPISYEFCVIYSSVVNATN